jgi:hypothetical protein
MRCAALVSLGLLASNVHAWGSAGHEIVATIAQVHLTPNAREALCFILPDYAKCHLAPIASWADRVRNPATGPMHYVGSKNDWPPSNCSFDGMWENTQRNVLVGVRNSTIGVMSLVGYVSLSLLSANAVPDIEWRLFLLAGKNVISL